MNRNAEARKAMNSCRNMFGSTVITASPEESSGCTAGEFVEIGCRHLFEVITQLLGQLCHIPEHITKLQLDRVTRLGVEHSVSIAHDLLDLVGHLTGLTAKTERWVRGITADIRVPGRAPGRILIGIELHDGV